MSLLDVYCNARTCRYCLPEFYEQAKTIALGETTTLRAFVSILCVWVDLLTSHRALRHYGKSGLWQF